MPPMTPTLTSKTLKRFLAWSQGYFAFLGDPCILFCGELPNNSFFLGEGIPSLPFAFTVLIVALFMIVVNDTICCFRSFNSPFLSLL